MQELPILKIELENMRATLHHALTQREVQMDAYFKDSLDRLLTEENIRKMVDDQVLTHSKRIIEEQVRMGVQRYYSTGPGREIMAKAVRDAVAADAQKALDQIEQERYLEETSHGSRTD